MGKSKDKTGSKKKKTSLSLTQRMKVNLNVYMGKAYCHLSDQKLNKSVSFNEEALQKLGQKVPAILERMKTLEAEEGGNGSSSDSDF